MKFFLKLTLITALLMSSTFADIDKVKDKFASSLENFLEGHFENTNFSIKKIETIKPELSIQTFKPLQDNEDSISFFQGSLFLHDSSRETINLGLGKRFFSEDDSMLFGINAFYDYEHDYSHQRFSIGTEIKSSILDLNYNLYIAESGSKVGKDNKNEEATDGYDLELGAHVPYIPSATFYTKAFDFEVSGGNDFQGLEYSTELKIPNSGLTIELGHTDYDNHNDVSFLNIKFSSGKINPGTKFITSEPYQKISMKDKKYDKVRRDNIIKKKGAAFTVKAGGF